MSHLVLMSHRHSDDTFGWRSGNSLSNLGENGLDWSGTGPLATLT